MLNISAVAQEKTAKFSGTWLVTGAAGFIGSNLLHALLSLNQKVIGLDNFATGKKENLEDVKSLLDAKLWANFTFVEGDIRNLEVCKDLCGKADIVLHQAALGSVPRSIKNPIDTHQVNVDGFLNMLVSAQETKVKRFVYASSSSVYGDNPNLPKVESSIGNPLSPYAASKLMNEIYASVFSKVHNFASVGLRYFNVFGPRQDPNGQYAAVIPRWINAVVQNEQCTIFGDGKTSRDFCFIENVVVANILAALSDPEKTSGHCPINIGNSDTTSLSDLNQYIRTEVSNQTGKPQSPEPKYEDFRPGDVRHSLADISKAKDLIEYEPVSNVREGLGKTVKWFLAKK